MQSRVQKAGCGTDFPTPLRTTANTALNIQAVTASAVVIANLQGFTAP